MEISFKNQPEQTFLAALGDYFPDYVCAAQTDILPNDNFPEIEPLI